MRIVTKIKEKTAHQRTCLFAALFMLLMMLSSRVLKALWPQCPDGLRILLTSSLPLGTVLVLYGRVRHLRINVFYRFKPIAPKAVALWILFGIGANCFATLLNAPIYSFLAKTEAVTVQTLSMPKSMGEYIAGIFFIGLLPAVLEELFCRGIVLREYETYGTVFSVLAAASMFAMLHMSLTSFVFTWILGIVLALVVLKTDSSYPAMIVHFSVNFFSLTRGYLTYLMPPMFYELWTVAQVFVLGIFAFGFAGVLFMLAMTHGRAHFKARNRSIPFGMSISFCFLILVYIFNHFRLIAALLK